VKYVGPVEDLPSGGLWVGVHYDEPVGKNDGAVAGTRYFDAGKNRGGFVRPEKVVVGDFPEEDIVLSENEEI
jgi:tubulin-folding cofactor B